MSKFRKTIAILLCLSIALSATLALAETATEPAEEITEAVAVAVPTLNDTDVVARVNGEDVTWAQVVPYYESLVSYYGAPDDSMLDTYRAFALETAIVMTLATQTAAQNGLDQYTDEEKAAIIAQADSDWQAALDNYVQNNSGLTNESTAEETAAAYEQAEAYYGEMGYNAARLQQDYLDRDIYDRVSAFVSQNVTVSEEEVLAQYQTYVQNDQAIYENDLDAYEYQLMLYSYQYVDEKPWYHPAGYRFVKHILLPVDETLMNAYTDLQARLEEQMNSEANDSPFITATEATDEPAQETAEETTEPEPTPVPVTQADIDNAKADILASLQEKTAEIYDKIAQGADFDQLIAEYALNADGTASDPGMTSGNYPNGYEVSRASTGFVPEFVEAAFSVEAVGDVSAPYISDYGVHIVQYTADVPAGAVELTDALKATIREALESEGVNAALDAWQTAANVEYTGLIPSMATIQGEDDTQAE